MSRQEPCTPLPHGCRWCAAGLPRLKDFDGRYYHAVSDADVVNDPGWQLALWVRDNLPSWGDNDPYYALAQKARELFAISAPLEVCRMVAKASMGEIRPWRAESFIGWQQGDGVTADQVREAARNAITEAGG